MKRPYPENHPDRGVFAYYGYKIKVLKMLGVGCRPIQWNLLYPDAFQKEKAGMCEHYNGYTVVPH